MQKNVIRVDSGFTKRVLQKRGGVPAGSRSVVPTRLGNKLTGLYVSAGAVAVAGIALAVVLAMSRNGQESRQGTGAAREASSSDLSLDRPAKASPEQAGPASAARHDVTPPGLQMLLTFDQSGGTRAPDLSGKRRDGTLVNGPSWVAGKSGNAAHFDGVSDYVRITWACLARNRRGKRPA